MCVRKPGRVYLKLERPNALVRQSWRLRDPNRFGAGHDCSNELASHGCTVVDGNGPNERPEVATRFDGAAIALRSMDSLDGDLFGRRQN